MKYEEYRKLNFASQYNKKKYKEYKKLNFNSQYEKKGYPKSVWPILNEYFSRFKFEYELSDSEIKDRLKRVMSNLNKIKIGYFGKSLETSGCYELYSKNIKIDTSKCGNNSLVLIDSIFHELNHVTDITSNLDASNDKAFDYGFMICDPKTKFNIGICLDEIITELKSKRLFYNETTKEKNLN